MMRLKEILLPNGMRVFALSATDTKIVYGEIFEDDLYRRNGIILGEGDCIVDIGANTGLFALYLNQICRKATVLAFEPVPTIFEALRRNVERHDRIGIRCFNLGVARQTGQAAFTYYPRLPSASTMHPNEAPHGVPLGQDFVLDQFNRPPWKWLFAWCPHSIKRILASGVCRFHLKSEKVTCSLTTVSDVIDEHRLEKIDFLKVDAEGSEYDILAGIREADWPRIRQLVVEVHDGERNARALSRQLEERGYTVQVDRNVPFADIFLVYGRR